MNHQTNKIHKPINKNIQHELDYDEDTIENASSIGRELAEKYLEAVGKTVKEYFEKNSSDRHKISQR